MQAAVITEFGAPSVFKITEVPIPALKPGYVLIKVCATSVNQIDVKIRSGAVSAIAPEFPAILHGDVAGIVTDIGAGVTQFKIGDEVFGCVGGLRGSPGALAEYILADARLLAKKPKTLSMTDAAALPLVSITAWEALFIRANLSKNQLVLIHGGVGGVGHIAVQLAKWRGAKVMATVNNSADIGLARSLGAEEGIDAKVESVEQYVKRLTNEHGFPFIFDTIGGPNLDRSFQAASINGVIVTTVSRSSHDLTPIHNKALSLHVVFMLLPILRNEGREIHGQILSEIANIVDLQQLKPLVHPEIFTLDRVADAHALLESGQAKGKIVIGKVA